MKKALDILCSRTIYACTFFSIHVMLVKPLVEESMQALPIGSSSLSFPIFGVQPQQ